jgi:hypothetical protein
LRQVVHFNCLGINFSDFLLTVLTEIQVRFGSIYLLDAN